MHKLLLLVGSIVIFVGLSVMLFKQQETTNASSVQNAPKNANTIIINPNENEKDKPKVTFKNNDSLEVKSSVTNSSLMDFFKLDFFKNDSSSKDSASKTEEFSDDVVIQNFASSVSNNVVNLSWNLPPKVDIKTLKIVRTSSSSDGGFVTYNVLDSKGKFSDTKIKPGIRYIYELQGTTLKGDVYSAQIFANINGLITLNTKESFFTVNSERRAFDVSKNIRPFLQSEKVYIPINRIIETLGGTLRWVSDNTNNKNKSQSAIIKYGKNEIELFSGNREMIINRIIKQIDYAPIFRDGNCYVTDSEITHLIGIPIKWKNDTLYIEKPVDVLEKNVEQPSENINVSVDQVFQIVLMDPTSDGKKWFYLLEDNSNIVLKSKRYEDTSKEVSTYILTFKAVKSGDLKLAIKYFSPKLGENPSDLTALFSIITKAK